MLAGMRHYSKQMCRIMSQLFNFNYSYLINYVLSYLIFKTTPRDGYYYYSHFTDEETEHQEFK